MAFPQPEISCEMSVKQNMCRTSRPAVSNDLTAGCFCFFAIGMSDICWTVYEMINN